MQSEQRLCRRIPYLLLLFTSANLSIYVYAKKGIGVESPYGVSPVPETVNVERAETVSPAAMLEKYAGKDVAQV
jgi:hypothetical protein